MPPTTSSTWSLLCDTAINNAIKDHGESALRDVVRRAVKPLGERIEVLEKENTRLKVAVSECQTSHAREHALSLSQENEAIKASQIAGTDARTKSACEGSKRRGSELQDNDAPSSSKRLRTGNSIGSSSKSQMKGSTSDAVRSNGKRSLDAPPDTCSEQSQEDTCVFVLTKYLDDEYEYESSAEVLGVYCSPVRARAAAQESALRLGFDLDHAIIEDYTQKNPMNNVDEDDEDDRGKMIIDTDGSLSIDFPLEYHSKFMPKYNLDVSVHRVKGASRALRKNAKLYLVLFCSSTSSPHDFGGTEFAGADFSVCGVYASSKDANEACKQEVRKYVFDEWNYKREVRESYRNGLITVDWDTLYYDDGGSEGPRIYFVEACKISE